MANQTLCDWCEQQVQDRDKTIRLSNATPFIGVPLSVPYVTVVFHVECWHKLEELLHGAKVRPAREVVDKHVGLFHVRVTTRGK